MSKRVHPQYEKDFYAWALDNARLLRQGKVTEIDIENIAEEIESMGKSERRDLNHRLAVLIAHLLKWMVQPILQGRSWELTIKEQRREIADLLAESPSLKFEIEKQLSKAYDRAIDFVEKETGIERKSFKKVCPFSLKQIINQRFFPE